MSSNQATAAHAVKLSAGGAVSRITRLTRLQLSDGDPIASGEDCFADGSGAMAKRQRPSHVSPGAASATSEGAPASVAAAAIPAAAAAGPLYTSWTGSGCWKGCGSR